MIGLLRYLYLFGHSRGSILCWRIHRIQSSCVLVASRISNFPREFQECLGVSEIKQRQRVASAENQITRQDNALCIAR